MILKRTSKFAKLRAKGGECRCLIPFAKELVEKYCSAEHPEEEGAKHAGLALADCYECLHKSTSDTSLFQTSAKNFALQMAGLHQLAKEQELKRWGFKPKMHLFLELSIKSSTPSKTWTYRDEDFGGSVSALASRRGGSNNTFSVSMSFCDRFAALHPMPFTQAV